MRILSIELVGNVFLAINNIHRISVDLTASYHVFLGTNGSGKTTVQRECTPWPPTTSHYSPGGKKVISVHHDSQEWLLSSFRGEKDFTHSFVCMSDPTKELNVGGTKTAQLELLQRWLGLDGDLLKLLLGDVNFTELTASKRSDWFTRISNTDFSFAFALYKRLKTNLRDTQGAYKNQAQRLTEETAKLSRIDNVPEMRREYNALLEDVRLMLSERGTQQHADVADIERRLNNEISTMEAIAEKILSLNIVGLGAVDDYKIAELEHLRTSVSSKLDVVTGLRLELPTPVDNDDTTVSQEYFDGLVQKYQELSEQSKWGVLPSAAVVKRKTDEIRDSVRDIIASAADNNVVKYTKDVYLSTEDKRNALMAKISGLEAHIERLEQHIKHTHVDILSCPNCKFEWDPTGSQASLNNTVALLQTQQATVESLKLELSAVDVRWDELRAFSIQLNSYRMVIHNYPELQPLWNKIPPTVVFNGNKEFALGVLLDWLVAVEASVKATHLKQEIDRLEHVLGVANAAGVASLAQHRENLDLEIETLTEQLGGIRSTLEKSQHAVKSLERLYVLGENLIATRERAITLQKELLDAMYGRHLDSAINATHARLGGLQSNLKQVDAIQSVIESIKLNHSQLENDQKAWALLVKSMSPSEGVIANALTEFINSTIDQINSVIDFIWATDLSVDPCKPTGEELTYLFPLRVNGKVIDGNNADVSDGSSAQRDVVNFAFRVVAARNLLSTPAPLYLDEFGRTFDQQHLNNAMIWLRSLVDAGVFTQLFFITHQTSTVDQFSDGEYLVLDPTNVTPPPTANQHAIIA